MENKKKGREVIKMNEKKLMPSFFMAIIGIICAIAAHSSFSTGNIELTAAYTALSASMLLLAIMNLPGDV